MISVLVCTYNRAPVLRRMLTAFFAQPCLGAVDHEIIVIDNNSTDGTGEVVREFETHAQLRCAFEPRQGLSAARNRGVDESRGDFIAFLDDDVIVDERWLERLQTCFEQTDADVVGGRSYLILEEDPPALFGPELRKCVGEVDMGPERRYLLAKQPASPTQPACPLSGLNLAFRRSALQAAGGFDESVGRKGTSLLCWEETAVIHRIAALDGVVVYDPDVVVGHIVGRERLTKRYFRRLAIGLGKSAALASEPAGMATRVAHVVRALIRALLQTPRLMWAWFAAPNAYRRCIVTQALSIKFGYVLGCWRRLWRAD